MKVSDESICRDCNEFAALAKQDDRQALVSLVRTVALQAEPAKRHKLYEQLAGVLQTLRKAHPAKVQKLADVKKERCQSLVADLKDKSRNPKLNDLDLIREVNSCLKAYPLAVNSLLGDFDAILKPNQKALATFGKLPKQATMRSSVKAPIILAMLLAEIKKDSKENNPDVVHIKRFLVAVGDLVSDPYGIMIADYIGSILYSSMQDVVAANPNEKKYQRYLNMLGCAIDRSWDPIENSQTFVANLAAQTNKDEIDFSEWVMLPN